MTTDCTKFHLRPALRQAYGCLWHYKLHHTLISILALLPFTIAGMAGKLTPVFTSGEILAEGYNTSLLIIMMSLFVWAIPCIILWHRLFLLGPEHLVRRKISPLLGRSLILIFQMLILLGAALLMAVGLMSVIIYLINIISIQAGGSNIHEVGGRELFLYIAGIVLLATFITLIAMRFSLVFSAQSIGKTLGFRTSWRLTRINSWRMLIAAILVTIPALSFVYLLLMATTAPYSKFFFILALVFAPVLTSPLALLCSLTSVFYRHCGAETHKEC